MTTTNNGMRTVGVRALRSSEKTVLVKRSTAVVARPSATPLTTDVVTASSGHNASSWTSATLSRHKPAAATLGRELFGGCIGSDRSGGAVELITVLAEV